MKILYFWLNTNSPIHTWQNKHFINELEKKDVKFHVFNPLDFISIEEANIKFISFLKINYHNYDLFLTCEGDSVLYTDTVKYIKSFSIPTLLICFDNLHVPFMHKKNAHLFDLVWLTSLETKYLFNKWNCNIIFQPYAANPLLNRGVNTFNEINVIGFIGSLYGARGAKLKYLIRHHLPCAVYSKKSNPNYKIQINNSLIENTFQHFTFSIGRKILLGYALENIKQFCKSTDPFDFNNFINDPVDFNTLINLYSRFSLSLNVTELRNTYNLPNPVHKIHLRSFEIPMFGGLQFAPYSHELSQYFEENKEIILFRSKDEMIYKATEYLSVKNNKLRMELKKNAFLRASRDHTWSNRFSKVFEQLFGKKIYNI